MRNNFANSPTWLKLFPEMRKKNCHPPMVIGDSPLGEFLLTDFGCWKLFPSGYFWRNFSLMKYRLNGRIFTPVELVHNCDGKADRERTMSAKNNKRWQNGVSLR